MIQTHRKKTKFMIQSCRKDIINDSDMQGEDKFMIQSCRKDINNDTDMQGGDKIYDTELQTRYKPEALKSLYRSPGYKKKPLVLCKNYVLQWQSSWNYDQHKKHKVCKGPSND